MESAGTASILWAQQPRQQNDEPTDYFLGKELLDIVRVPYFLDSVR